MPELSGDIGGIQITLHPPGQFLALRLHRAGGPAFPVFRVFDSRSRDFGIRIRDLSRPFGTACEGRRLLNLGANRAKRVTLWLLGAIKGELLAAAIGEHRRLSPAWFCKL
jgi:hypothetical protein